jgi:hypothetical protein
MDKLPVPVMRQLLAVPAACRELVRTAFDVLDQGSQTVVPVAPARRTYGETPLVVTVEQGRRHIEISWQKRRYRHLPVKGFCMAHEKPPNDADEAALGRRILDDPAPRGALELNDLSWDTQYFLTFFIDKKRRIAFPFSLFVEGYTHQRYGIVTFSVHLGGYGAIKSELTEMNTVADMLGNLNKKLDLSRIGIDTSFLRSEGKDEHARTFEKLYPTQHRLEALRDALAVALEEHDKRIAEVEANTSLSRQQKDDRIRQIKQHYHNIEQQFRRAAL